MITQSFKGEVSEDQDTCLEDEDDDEQHKLYLPALEHHGDQQRVVDIEHV